MSVPIAATTASDLAASHIWEDAEHTWENSVREDADGRIIFAAGETLADAIRQRRKRLEASDYYLSNKRIVREMIRYVYIVLDASRWMRQKDPVLPPGMRIDAAVSLLQDFVVEFFDQNPLSHLGFIVLKNGEAEILTQLSTNSATHKMALKSVIQMAAMEGPQGGGEFSLQNGIEVAGRSLGHQPRHGSREIVVLTAALSTCDPGFILTDTLPKLQRARIRVSCFALTAELHICRKLAEETNGTMGVCLDKPHFKDWLWGQCVPPPALHSDDQGMACEMIHMGFPTRTSEIPSLIHASREKTIIARTAYTCPQCQAKNAELPTDCAVCGLKLVLAPHLARSFHHLFPVQPFSEQPVEDKRIINETVTSTSAVTSGATAGRDTYSEKLSSSIVVSSASDDLSCYACLRMLGVVASADSASSSRVEELLRFQCPECHNHFCVDCDAFLHGTLHNCPGCLRRF
jgi:transcription initiation factor TFIIH subunit 2